MIKSALVLALVLGAVVAAPTVAASRGNPEVQANAVTPMLASDGRFLGASGSGVLDTGTWRLDSDMGSGEQPRLVPAGAPATSIFSNSISAMAIFNGDLYVGGFFGDVAGIPEADWIARWDGTAWRAVGSNGAGNGALNGGVHKLVVFGTKLVVGGSFTNAANLATADRVAAWNGSSWSALGSDGSGDGALNNYVDAFGVQGSDLIVGGGFTNAANTPEADWIARWNGSTWSALGSNGSANGALNGDVYAIAVSGTNIYAGGEFTDVAGIAEADNIALYNGTAWSALGSNGAGNGALNSWVVAIVASGSNVYVGGNFTNVNGPNGDYFALFNGSWSAQGTDGAGGPALNSAVWVLAPTTGGVLAGGTFTNAGGVAAADYLALWTGSAWSTVGAVSGNAAFDGPVESLLVDGTDVIVGGGFAPAAGDPANEPLGRWNGVKWSAYVSGKPDGRIRKGTGSFVGNNIYNSDGTNQVRVGAKPRGDTIVFGISVQNDNNTSDSFRVAASGTSTTMYGVRYFRGTTEITSAVAAGTYHTPTVAVGGSVLIIAKVKVKSSATIGSSVTRLVTSRSDAAPSIVDAVKFIGKRK